MTSEKYDTYLYLTLDVLGREKYAFATSNNQQWYLIIYYCDN